MQRLPFQHTTVHQKHRAQFGQSGMTNTKEQARHQRAGREDTIQAESGATDTKRAHQAFWQKSAHT
eukprot:3327097-Amphidinium_carterae.1